MDQHPCLPKSKPTLGPKSPASNPPPRILVVDDDNAIRRLTGGVLNRSGYAVDQAADGAAAWEALNTETYDLLVTDHEMPKLSGLELLKKLRTARMALPVILISGAMPTEELSRHPWLKIDAALIKPFSPTKLLGTVRELLGTSGRVEG